MSARTTYREQESSIIIGVETDENLPGEMYREGALMRPNRVRIRWDYDYPDGWKRHITILGKHVRKDGTVGTADQYLSIDDEPGRWTRLLLADAPAWVQQIVADHTPPIPQDHVDRWEIEEGGLN